MLKSHHVEELHDAASLIADLLAMGITVSFEAHGTSMVPSIQPGAKLRIEPAATVSVGEVVLCRRGARLVAHRVVAIRKSEIVTRGDNCTEDDEPFPLSDLLGVASLASDEPAKRSRFRPARLLRLIRLTLAPLRRIGTNSRVRKRTVGNVSSPRSGRKRDIGNNKTTIE